MENDSREMSCEGCRWHDSFTWVCFNGYSEHVADFVNKGCRLYDRDNRDTEGKSGNSDDGADADGDGL